MSDYRVQLEVGASVLLPSGYGLVTEVHRLGCTVRNAIGENEELSWIDLVPMNGARGTGRAAHIALRPLLDTLPQGALDEMTDWVEVVQILRSGYALAHPELALDGEPFYPYGPTFGVSIDKQCERMAAELSHERNADRQLGRRVRRGDLKSTTVSKNTVRNKLMAFEAHGVVGLIDGRKIRRTDKFQKIDETFRATIDEIVGTLDGDRSTISHREILRRARVSMKKRGLEHYKAPQRATAEYISWLMSRRGSTTRAQRSTKLRGASAKSTFEAVRPGQVVAIDATRSDVLVWDPTHERAFSVEIITAIDVATRVVLALRVVPKSADGVDAGLLLYDVLRPFCVTVAGTTISHWRWAGLPGAVDLGNVSVTTENGPVGNAMTLQGEHHIPSVLPGAIRADHGPIFVGAHFRALLRDFGIDLMLSRGTRPTDNAYIERLHETFQRAYQALPGFKGRNVAGRGRKVEHEPVCTAAELEEHLRRWVALDYHQSWHQGLVLPSAPQARLTPIELFDAMLQATGRIDVPQSPTLLYQFLSVRWGTIRHNGVEFTNLVYDAACLDDFRNVRKGEYRANDRAMPFFYDPHDVSRIWWHDPDTGLVHEVPWRADYLCDAPMTDKVLDHVLTGIRRRGGNLALNVESTQRLILDELTELTTTPSTREWRAAISAAARRVETSTRDHAEAQEAQAAALVDEAKVTHIRTQTPGDVSEYDDEWPDLGEVRG